MGVRDWTLSYRSTETAQGVTFQEGRQLRHASSRLTTCGSCWGFGHARGFGEDTLPLDLLASSELPWLEYAEAGAESSASSGKLKGPSADHYRESEPLPETAPAAPPSAAPSN